MTVAIQRPLRGSRISSFYPVKSLPSLASLDSAFQLQEYISLLIRLDVHDVDTIVSVPGKSDNKDKESDQDDSLDKKSEVAVDEACWIYEQLRRLAQDLSHPLITMLQQECNRSSCPEMKAGEWLYLCVAHGNDAGMEQCCAIDYILHTLDSATALLNSPRAFPSRLQIPQTSHRHFSSLARRLGRIFAHAYFHHREVFEQAEAESSLYARFLALTSKFDLVPAEFLVIPPRLMNNESDSRDIDVDPPRLMAAAVDPQVAAEESPPSEEDAPKNSGSESPRKLGRNRTDTMVFSDTFNLSEEVAKQEETGPVPTDTIVLSEEPSASPSTSEEEQPKVEVPAEERDITVEAAGQDAPEDIVTPSSSTAPQELPPTVAVTQSEEQVDTSADVSQGEESSEQTDALSPESHDVVDATSENQESTEPSEPSPSASNETTTHPTTND